MRVERLSDGATVAAVLDRGPRKQTSCALGISTGQTWVLPNRPGHHFSRVLAMTPTELVLGERVVATIVSPVLDHIVRIELAALPALVAEWSK